MTDRKRLVWVVVLFLLGAWIRTQEAQAEDDATLRELESYELLLRLKTAPEPPMPQASVYPDAETKSAEQRSLVAYDLAIGELITSEARSDPGADSLSTASRQPMLPWDVDNEIFTEPEGEDPELTGRQASCTAPSPLLGTHGFPWSTNYKLLMRFNTAEPCSVSGDCSATVPATVTDTPKPLV